MPPFSKMECPDFSFDCLGCFFLNKSKGTSERLPRANRIPLYAKGPIFSIPARCATNAKPHIMAVSNRIKLAFSLVLFMNFSISQGKSPNKRKCCMVLFAGRFIRSSGVPLRTSAQPLPPKHLARLFLRAWVSSLLHQPVSCILRKYPLLQNPLIRPRGLLGFP